MPPHRLPLLALVTALALTAAGCASGGSAPPRVSTPLIPAPASGTAWQIKANGGADTYGETSPDGSPWITVGGDGSINARIPASAATQQAAPAVQQGTVGSLQIRRAP